VENITLRIEDHNGNMVEEENITINDGDILVVYMDGERSHSVMEAIGKSVKRALSGELNALVLPEWVKLRIIKVGG